MAGGYRKVVLEQYRESDEHQGNTKQYYVVKKLINATEPYVGKVLSRAEVRELLETLNYTVTIVAGK